MSRGHPALAVWGEPNYSNLITEVRRPRSGADYRRSLAAHQHKIPFPPHLSARLLEPISLLLCCRTLFVSYPGRSALRRRWQRPRSFGLAVPGTELWSSLQVRRLLRGCLHLGRRNFELHSHQPLLSFLRKRLAGSQSLCGPRPIYLAPEERRANSVRGAICNSGISAARISSRALPARALPSDARPSSRARLAS